MANTATKAILKALINGAVQELMAKTTGDMVYIDETTTVSAKLAEMILAINARAKTEDVNAAISALRQEILGGEVPEALDTIKEIYDYITAHEDIKDALQEAINDKADRNTVEQLQSKVNGLGALAQKNEVSESDLDAELMEKVNSLAESNHTHNNLPLLQTYTQTEENLKDAVNKKHSHSNMSALNSITDNKVAEWNGKSHVYFTPQQPGDLTENDLWVQIV